MEGDERTAELRLKIQEKYGYKKRDPSGDWDSVGQDFAGVTFRNQLPTSSLSQFKNPTFATPTRGKNCEREENRVPYSTLKIAATKSEPRSFAARPVTRTTTPHRSSATCIRTGVRFGKSGASSSTLRPLNVSLGDAEEAGGDVGENGDDDDEKSGGPKSQITNALAITPTGLVSAKNDETRSSSWMNHAKTRPQADAADNQGLKTTTPKNIADATPQCGPSQAPRADILTSTPKWTFEEGPSTAVLSEVVSPRIRMKTATVKSPGTLLATSNDNQSLEEFVGHVSSTPSVSRTKAPAAGPFNSSSSAAELGQNLSVGVDAESEYPNPNSFLAHPKTNPTLKIAAIINEPSDVETSMASRRPSWSRWSSDKKRAPKRRAWTKRDDKEKDESFEIDDDTDSENTPKKRKEARLTTGEVDAENRCALTEDTVHASKKKLEYDEGINDAMVKTNGPPNGPPISRERVLSSEDERIPLATLMGNARTKDEKGKSARAETIVEKPFGEAEVYVEDLKDEEKEARESWKSHPFARKGKKKDRASVDRTSDNGEEIHTPHETEGSRVERAEMHQVVHCSAPKSQEHRPPSSQQQQRQRDACLDISVVSSSSSSSPLESSSKLGFPGRQILLTSRYVAPDPNEKKQRKKYKKGGLAERLAKITNRERSEVAFWCHKVRKANGALSTKIKTIKIQILSSPMPVGCIFLAECCQVLDEGDEPGCRMHVAFSRENVDALNVKRGSFVNICEPWRTAELKNERGNGFDDDAKEGSFSTELIYCTNYCFVLSSSGDVEMTEGARVEKGKETEAVDGQSRKVSIWRDVVSEMYANVEDDLPLDVALGGESDGPSHAESRKTTEKTPTLTSVDDDGVDSREPTSTTSPLLPFLPSEEMADESVPIPAEVAFFSQIRLSFSATLTQRHNITVCVLYAIPPSAGDSSSSRSTRLYCLDGSSTVAVVRVSTVDSFAPSVFSSLQSGRRLLVRLEGVILLRGDAFVLDAYACVLECSSSESNAFPFSLSDAPRRIPAFDDDVSSLRVSDLRLFSGRILGIDFENAFSERVCPDCSSPIDDDADDDRRRVYCSPCDAGVAPIDRVTMHVFVEERRPDGKNSQRRRPLRVKIMLTSDFAQRLLPPVRDGEHHYDADQVLRQPLERLPCLVERVDEESRLILLQQVELLAERDGS